jgi:hypothetical protein
MYRMSSMHTHRNYATDLNACLTIRQFAYYCTENNVGKLARQIKIYDTSVANGAMCYFNSSGKVKLLNIVEVTVPEV